MKKGKAIFKKPLGTLCSLLVLLAPLAVTNSACFYFWGEPECPDALKESLSSK